MRVRRRVGPFGKDAHLVLERAEEQLPVLNLHGPIQMGLEDGPRDGALVLERTRLVGTCEWFIVEGFETRKAPTTLRSVQHLRHGDTLPAEDVEHHAWSGSRHQNVEQRLSGASGSCARKVRDDSYPSTVCQKSYLSAV